MTEKSTKIDKMSNLSKPVPMKLFAAWEVDRTPSNCIPRLCSLTITKLSLLGPLPPDLTSLSLAVKMQSSKRTLRSHEISLPHCITPSDGVSTITTSASMGSNAQSSLKTTIGNLLNSPPILETELDLHFSLQYPHFIKRDGNRLLILLQRRKKYKTRTILGYKTLAEGVIRMDAVLQKSMDMTVELISTTAKAGRAGAPLATLRAERVSSIPVDHDNKNNNSVLMADRVNEYSDEDEEFSSGEENDDGILGYEKGRGMGGERGGGSAGYAKRDLRKYRKLERGEQEGEDGALGANPVDSDSEFENIKEKGSRAKISRRNFKQKIVALLKRFKVPDEMDGIGNNRGSGALRSGQDLDAFFQELDEFSCGEGDDSCPDMDSLSVGSTPKPSLRPFFSNSRSALHDSLIGEANGKKKSTEKRDTGSEKKSPNSATPEKGSDWRNDSSGNEGGAGNTDPDAPNSDPQNTGSPPREKESLNDRRNRLFRTPSSNMPTSNNKKKQQSLSFSTEPKSSLETCLSPTNVEPRKSLLEQLSRTFATEEAALPDVVTLIGPPEPISGLLAARLSPLLASSLRPSFSPQNTAEVKAVLQALMNKIQKYCNSTAKPPSTIKVLLLGGDWLQGAVLRHYVDLLGVRPPDWVNHIRFYIVPIGSSVISRYLSTIDMSYAAMFSGDNWQQLCERAANVDQSQTKADIVEITNRVQRYLHTAGPCTQIPIAEAMVNYKDEDSCQIFVPFVSDVRILCADGPQLSLDFDENVSSPYQMSSGSLLSSSPPLSGRISPPLPPSTPIQPPQEPLELQIDYWPLMRPSGDNKEKNQTKGTDQGKNSIKSTFRSLQVWRLPPFPQSGEISNGLTVSYATKEKKQKSRDSSIHFMRLGKKKEKDREMEKEQCVEGVARLICSPKQSHPVPLRVYIDGTEWTGVKFFQLSSQWQTHVKNFPVGLIGIPLVPSDLT